MTLDEILNEDYESILDKIDNDDHGDTGDTMVNVAEIDVAETDDTAVFTPKMVNIIQQDINGKSYLCMSADDVAKVLKASINEAAEDQDNKCPVCHESPCVCKGDDKKEADAKVKEESSKAKAEKTKKINEAVMNDLESIVKNIALDNGITDPEEYSYAITIPLDKVTFKESSFLEDADEDFEIDDDIDDDNTSAIDKKTNKIVLVPNTVEGIDGFISALRSGCGKNGIIIAVQK